MVISLTPLELFYGSLTFIAVIISVILGIFIALKYISFKKIEFLFVGFTWILIVSPYWSDAIQFITILTMGQQISTGLYFFIANAFIAPIHVTWIYAITKFIFKKHKKTILTVFIIEALAYEIMFLFVYFINPNYIGEQKSVFVVEWAIWIQVYLLISIALFLITGFAFTRQSFRSDNRELKFKGIFLLIAFIMFAAGAVIDVIGAESPSEITIFLARTFLIISAICFYVGFTLPRFIKNLFLK
jgi:hypothetical protein